ncbi:hypothetical protein RRG08_008900 [Elysia crispata]|uniref:RRM domain-containing protein n=1 Tax=Elysia crispata TaxID=231223 RepID=A0AAE0ZXE0_9GAST|nr:hypothetical protein RRG08_008900 [Elysia crispata]
MACFDESVQEPRNKFCHLFVKNFRDTLDDGKLNHLFSTFGEVTRAVVKKTSQGQSLGYGFVSFRHPEDASAAIKCLNGFLVNCCELYVDYYQTRDERSIVLASYLMLEGTNLLVQNLGRSIDDSELKSLFSSFGTITSAKVMKNNRSSLSHGFVCYSTVAAAQRALEGMNNRIVHGNKLCVTVHEKKSPQTKTNLRVSNLDSRVNDQILQENFRKFGNIISAKVMTKNNGDSKNYGFVCYSSFDDAQSAIEHMDNQRLGYQVIRVELDQPKKGQKRIRRNSRSISESSSEPVNKNKILIKDLAPCMTEDWLVAKFSRFGSVVNSQVLKTNGESQGHGIITFSSRSEAERAIWELDNCLIDGKSLDLQLVADDEDSEDEGAQNALSEDDLSSDEELQSVVDHQQKKTNLYVKNLHPDIDDEELREMFSFFGDIDNVKVARTVQGKSKQFGFVNFTSYKAASRAVEKMHGSLEKGMSLYVTFHQTKSERNSFLEQRLFQRLQGLALKDQKYTVSSQRQRAVSQDRRNTHNHEVVRNRAARARSCSQAPTSRTRSQLSIPMDRLPQQRDHGQENEEINRPSLQIHRDPDTADVSQKEQKKNLRSLVSITNEERHDNDYHVGKMNSRGRIRPVSETTFKSPKVSIGQHLYYQFSMQSGDQDKHQAPKYFDSPSASPFCKPTPTHFNEEPETAVMKPWIPQPRGNETLKEKALTQHESQRSNASDVDVMRKVNAFLHMSDEQVLQHLKFHK